MSKGAWSGGQVHATDGEIFEWLEVEMVTDDDVYVRVGHIIADISQAGQHRGLYVGELSDTLHPTPLAPIRDPSEAYYASKQSYPLKHFPPYAGGPHYLVSMDCVRFIAKNRRRLASVGGIEDISIALPKPFLSTLKLNRQQVSCIHDSLALKVVGDTVHYRNASEEKYLRIRR